MGELIHPPSARALINSLRAIGYSFDAALADIVDNSITANAHAIRISMRAGSSPYVAILDNGHGMPRQVLIEAMRHGGVGPNVPRGEHDLGRYGLGLKTASLSQCRRLTVASIAEGDLSVASWDLDEIERRDDWVLSLLSNDETKSVPGVSELVEQGIGTLVLWENFDRAVAGESSPGNAIERLVDGSREYLSLVFHRFLSPDGDEEPVEISINGLNLKAIDPFLSSNRRTEKLPPELIYIDGQPVRIQPYILPHLSNIKEEELLASGGRERLKASQGFYVYRSRRLITSGTWFRMVHHDELNKLARVRVDVPNSLDYLWDLDVKKSQANPPEEVRKALRRIVERITQKSQNVFKERRRRAKGGAVTHLWDRARIREGICYVINREHPFVMDCLDALSNAQRSNLERLMSMVEVGLPVAAIYADMANDRSVEIPEETVLEELSTELAAKLQAIGNDTVAREKFLAALPKLDPFSMYPVITRNLIKELESGEQQRA